MGPFLFNGLRFAMGCVPLLPFLIRSNKAPRRDVQHRALRGIFLGFVLFVAVSLQQIGIQYTTVGKAGFITGLYVVFVPLLGLVLGSRIDLRSGVGVALAAMGLYLLTLGDSGMGDERTQTNLGDLLMLVSAIFWAIHILAVGRWATSIPWPELAITQFATCAAASLCVGLVLETISVDGIIAATVPLLYAGVLSVGVGYSIQVIAQQHAPPTPAAILMSLETLFAVVGGWWLLSESLGPRQILGCGLMLLAMLLSSIRARAD